MFFVGLVLPLPLGAWLIRKRRADLPLSLIGLASVPVLLWGAALGAKIGPCKVGPCMTHTQHSHLEVAIAAFVILLVAFGVLGQLHQKFAGGGVLIVSQLVGAYSMLKTDVAAAVMLVLFALSAGGYLLGNYLADKDAKRVPDFPPVA
jgi:hypothetical protein